MFFFIKLSLSNPNPSLVAVLLVTLSWNEPNSLEPNAPIANPPFFPEVEFKSERSDWGAFCQQQAAESRLELTLKPNLKQNLKPIIPVQKSDSSKQNMDSHGENNKSSFEDLGKAAC